MSNKIEVIQGNSKTVECTVTGLSDLDGYTALMIVKKDARDDDDDKLFEQAGTIAGLVVTIPTTAAQNTVAAGSYVYEVVITNGSLVYSVTQDIYKIMDSVKY